MTEKTIHVVAPFHSRLVREKWSHCALTQIVIKQIRIFRALGWRVIDYANFGSESEAHEHVELLGREEFLNHFLDDGRPAQGNAVIGSPGWTAWWNKLEPQISSRASGLGDHIVAHTFGDAASGLVKTLPGCLHLETHIGYDRPGFGARRVFVSEAWRNFLFGKYGSDAGDHRWSWTVLPYYDREDWPFVERAKTSDPYVAFLGRMTLSKGLSTIVEIARKMPDLEFRMAGSGMQRTEFYEKWNPPRNLVFIGEMAGHERARYLGSASAVIVPTDYLEPCAGVVCEAALCGTPAVASSWGGFLETVERGKTGYLASTLAEWISGIKAAFQLDRRRVHENAIARFSLEVAATQYGEILERLLSLKKRGWYTMPGEEDLPEGSTGGARNITHDPPPAGVQLLL